MSDIKNLFVETFQGYDFSQFSQNDLIRMGIKQREDNRRIKKQQKEYCPRKRNSPLKSETEKIFNRNKIIPMCPSPESPQKWKYKHIIKKSSILDEIEASKARHRLYYHTHREELKWKRLVKQGRTELIELLLNTVPD